MGGIVERFFFTKKAQNLPKTPFEEKKIRPSSVPKEELKPAPIATEDISNAFHELKIAQKNLEDLQASLSTLANQYAKQVAELKTQEGFEGKAAEYQNKIEQLKNLMAQTSSAENVVIDFESFYVALERKKIDRAFNPDVKWKLEKLIEKYGQEAKTYLERAINGAQSLATKEEQVRLITFPKIGQMDQVGEITKNLKGFIETILKLEGNLEKIVGE